MVGNTTGILLGFTRHNALSQRGAARLARDCAPQPQPLPGAAAAPWATANPMPPNASPAPKFSAAAQAFIVDPGTEWEKALADLANKAVIDMAGNQFSCDPLRIFPADVAGGYWLDYMVPMMSLDPRSTPYAGCAPSSHLTPANASASAAPPRS